MKTICKILVFLAISVSTLPASAEEPELGLTVVKVKNKGSWTEVMIAVENKTGND